MNCNACGAQNAQESRFCVKCGAGLTDGQPAQAQALPATIVNNVTVPAKTNGIGTAGFVCALVAVFTCWIPVLGWILWLVGAVLSIVGIFRQPRVLAIAGTVISFIDLILLIVVVGGLAAAIGAGASML